MKPKRIAVIDDHRLKRETVVNRLSMNYPEARIDGFDTLHDLLESIRSSGAYDCYILDYTLDTDVVLGTECIGPVRDLHPDAYFIGFSDHPEAWSAFVTEHKIQLVNPSHGTKALVETIESAKPIG